MTVNLFPAIVALLGAAACVGLYRYRLPLARGLYHAWPWATALGGLALLGWGASMVGDTPPIHSAWATDKSREVWEPIVARWQARYDHERAAYPPRELLVALGLGALVTGGIFVIVHADPPPGYGPPGGKKEAP